MSVSLYGSAELETSKNGDETVYSAAISGEDAQKLAAILLPSMADEAGALREVSMSLAEQDGTLENLVFEIALSDEANTALSLTLTPRHGAAEDAEIPEAVLSAMQSGENTANITLTDDVFRLLRAWAGHIWRGRRLGRSPPQGGLRPRRPRHHAGPGAAAH